MPEANQRCLSAQWLVVIIALAGWGSSCSSVSRVPILGDAKPLRAVVFPGQPTDATLEQRARRVCAESYPRIRALLPSDPVQVPDQFDLVFKHLKSANSGETDPGHAIVYVNTDYLTNRISREENLDRLLVHEMVHLVQQYPGSGLVRPGQTNSNFGWHEGIADFARYKLIGTNGWSCPQCNGAYPHYSSGYTCAGAFLLYVSDRYGDRPVQELHRALCRGTNPEAVFRSATGETLAELWAEFQQTPQFTVTARRAFELEQALGFVAGRPPRDFARRFARYVHQHADSATEKLINQARLKGSGMEAARTRMTFYLYLTQPGGTPEQLITTLQKADRLPGFQKGEHGSIFEFLSFEELTAFTYPFSRTLVCHKLRDAGEYRYTVERASESGAWRMTRAWHCQSDGTLLQELDVTAANSQAN